MAMDPVFRQRMLAYYNERASEYEEAYTCGTGTASITDPTVFITEAAELTRIVGRFGKGDVIDLGCGTGYWLPHYAPRCAHVTLFDQSERMLAECERKVHALAIADRCTLIRGDVFNHDFAQRAYDCAFIGFLISHLSEAQEQMLFRLVRSMLGPCGRVLVLDSAWTELRATFNEKVGCQGRRLNDGTTFEIYKRYLDREDIAGWQERHKLVTSVEYYGDALCAVSGHFQDA